MGAYMPPSIPRISQTFVSIDHLRTSPTVIIIRNNTIPNPNINTRNRWTMSLGGLGGLLDGLRTHAIRAQQSILRLSGRNEVLAQEVAALRARDEQLGQDIAVVGKALGIGRPAIF
jgi:hypothetical protein